MFSSSWLKLAYIAVGLISVLIAPIVVVSDPNLRTISIEDHHHRQLQATEVLYLNIMEVDETPEFNTDNRKFYEVRARVRIVEQTNAGLVRGNIIRFVTYINLGQGTQSPVLVVEDRCIYAKLKLDDGKYVLADGNDSLTYFPRDVCYVPVEDPGFWIKLLRWFVGIFIPGK